MYLINAKACVLAHTCSHTLFVWERVCALDAYFALLYFLQHMSTTIYVYPSALNIRMEMFPAFRWGVIRVSKAWSLRRFILLIFYTLSFTCMYLINAHACEFAHTCSHTLFMWARVCAQDADFTLLYSLQPMSTTIYFYPCAWNTRMEMFPTCRWGCDSCFKGMGFASVYSLFLYCSFYMHVLCQRWRNKNCELWNFI